MNELVRSRIPGTAEKPEGAGSEAGDAIVVTLREDRGPRSVEVPRDLVAALPAARLRETLDTMSYSHREGWTRAIADPKRAETRAKRIRDCVEATRSRPALRR